MACLIFTYAHSRPDFIELQCRTFRAFLHDEYEFIIFNDAPNQSLSKQIKRTCEDLGIRCFTVPPHAPGRQQAGYRHSDSISYSLNTLGYRHDGIVVLLDADMFLIKPFEIEAYMADEVFIGGYQARRSGSNVVVYSLPSLVFMRISEMPNIHELSFEGAHINGLPCDVGGCTYYYFENNPLVNPKLYNVEGVRDLQELDSQQLAERGYDENSISFISEVDGSFGFEFHADANFIHYLGGGSNWPKFEAEYLHKKDQLLYEFVDLQLSIYSRMDKTRIRSQKPEKITKIARSRVLHMSFHMGCINEIKWLADELDLELESWYLLSSDHPPKHFDGYADGNAVYNICYERARRVWERHHQYFDQFDMVMVSDTAPLARIFLQNGWTKPLIIWVCNRFDYADHNSLDCEFPDQQYYDLFRTAAARSNVRVVSYTHYERVYARSKKVELGDVVIQPTGAGSSLTKAGRTQTPENVVKTNTLFLYPRLNGKETEYVLESCSRNEIDVFKGNYDTPADLEDYRGVLYFPYAYSNLSLFENIRLGIIHFVPHEDFYRQYCRIHDAPMRDLPHRELSEWYAAENRDLFVYFRSWEDLKRKLDSTSYASLRRYIRTWARDHESVMLHRWRQIFAGLSQGSEIHRQPKPKFHRPLQTLDAISRILLQKKKGAFLRFGDGEINIASGTGGSQHQAYNANLQQELQDCCRMRGENVLLALPLNCREYGGLESEMFPGNHERSFGDCTLMLQNVEKYRSEQMEHVYSTVALHYAASYHLKESLEFLSCLKGSNCTILVGREDMPEWIRAMLFGPSCHFVPVPGFDAYDDIDNAEKACLDVLGKRDEYQVVVTAAGVAGTVLQKRLWNKTNNVFLFDFGSLIDALCGLGTRAWMSSSSFDHRDFLNRLDRKVNLIFTAALIDRRYAERKTEYINSLKIIKSYGYTPTIVETCKPGNTFLDEYAKVIYSGVNDTNARNKGASEVRALLSADQYLTFSGKDIIVKLTGRYYFNSDWFLRLVEQEKSYDAFVKLDQFGQVFTGCFAISYNHYIALLETLDPVKMEADMINLERAVAEYVKTMDQDKVMYVDRLRITANIFGDGSTPELMDM